MGFYNTDLKNQQETLTSKDRKATFLSSGIKWKKGKFILHATVNDSHLFSSEYRKTTEILAGFEYFLR